jgi:hypothetical protein
MITRRSANALVLGRTDPRLPDEEPRNSRVISYCTSGKGAYFITKRLCPLHEQIGSPPVQQ